MAPRRATAARDNVSPVARSQYIQLPEEGNRYASVGGGTALAWLVRCSTRRELRQVCPRRGARIGGAAACRPSRPCPDAAGVSAAATCGDPAAAAEGRAADLEPAAGPAGEAQ